MLVIGVWKSNYILDNLKDCYLIKLNIVMTSGWVKIFFLKIYALCLNFVV